MNSSRSTGGSSSHHSSRSYDAGSPVADFNGGSSRTQGLPRYPSQPTPQMPPQTQTRGPQQQSSTGSGVLSMREKQSQGVEQVILSAEVFFVCMTHALTTEKDEICGLLLGQPSEDGRRIDITACFPLPRGTHRQKDRVEITPLQMAMGVEHADALEKSHRMNVRVVGWYHSHPRLMPIPSSVDVRSQEACEQQDPTFVGLIFTPFNAASKQTPLTQQLQLLAFKSDKTSSLGFRQLPISVVDYGRGKSGLGGLSRWALDTLLNLLTVLQSEEDELMSQVEHGSENFLASTAYSYRLMRVMNEIGFPLIEALESRLQSSGSEKRVTSISESDGVQKLLDASSLSPSHGSREDHFSALSHTAPQGRSASSTSSHSSTSYASQSQSQRRGGSPAHSTSSSSSRDNSSSKSQLYQQTAFGTNV